MGIDGMWPCLDGLFHSFMAHAIGSGSINVHNALSVLWIITHTVATDVTAVPLGVVEWLVLIRDA